MALVDKETGETSYRDVIADKDEGIREGTNYEGVSQIRSAIDGGVIAAGNASQFSDGASAQVVMDESEARKRNSTHFRYFSWFFCCWL